MLRLRACFMLARVRTMFAHNLHRSEREREEKEGDRERGRERKREGENHHGQYVSRAEFST
jgi:hypothetical protein